MKKLIFALLLCAGAALSALAQSNAPLVVTEIDGSPRATNVTTLVFSNGSVTCSSSRRCTVTTGGGGGSGTVTSVAQSFTGGLISVGGSPITTSGTLALTVAGTSGGVPYFSSTSTWASSAALAANAIVIGGGAGAAPSTTTTATGILTFLGTPSSANLASAVTDETGSGALVFGTSPTISSLNAASTVSFGTGTGTGKFTGVICASAATATTSGTTEETVATCTIPANSMSADAKGVRVTAFFSTAATTNNKTIKLQYGATVLQTVTKNTTSGSVKLEAIVLRDGATSQKGFSRQFWTLAGTWIDDLQNFTTPAETLSGSVDLTIKLTTATAAAGASLQSYVVEFIN